jgi:hypothetical protein
MLTGVAFRLEYVSTRGAVPPQFEQPRKSHSWVGVVGVAKQAYDIVAPAADIIPVPQEVQLELPGELPAKYPPGQVEHATAKEDDEYMPAGQLVHVVTAAPFVYTPTAPAVPTTATSIAPSLDDATADHAFDEDMTIQEAPESVEVCRNVLAATIILPSADKVMAPAIHA